MSVREILVFLFLLQCLGRTAESLEPVNHNASPEARSVLNYLNSIQGQKTLAGHHVMYGTRKDEDLRYIVGATERYPALIEFEAGIFEQKYSEHYARQQRQLVQDAISYWSEGGLIAICWHWGNPLLPRNTYENTKIEFDIEAALQEGTPEHAALIRDLDVTAEMLKELQRAQVPVLWRPLHEICGGWFWWGMQGDESGRKLWMFIYKYYTKHHELNHLIWVYSASQEMRTEWFPGLDYADVVAVDIYRRGQQGERANFDTMRSIAGDKPVALSECDLIPDPDVLHARGFLWNWFTTWHSRYMRSNDRQFLKRVYQHELVITRDELPVLKELR